MNLQQLISNLHNSSNKKKKKKRESTRTLSNVNQSKIHLRRSDGSKKELQYQNYLRCTLKFFFF